MKKEYVLETAAGKVKLGNNQCAMLRIAGQLNDEKTFIKSGTKLVAIKGDRSFFLGLGKTSEGKTRFWFAIVRRGMPVFRLLKDEVAKHLIKKSKVAGELRPFKPPGFQTEKNSKFAGLE
jgi:hypothetical protein